jgi:chromate transporter
VDARRALPGVDWHRVVETRMIPPVLIEVAAQFLVLSLLSIGGANAVIPEIHLRAVETEHWMTDADFAQLFALSQAAPGPNVLIVSLIGWKVAGVLGGIVAMLAMSGPSSVLTYGVAHAWERWRDAPWRIAIQRGLASVTVGLILASGYILTRSADHSWGAYAISGATLLLSLSTRLHPLLMLGVAAAMGAFGFA